MAGPVTDLVVERPEGLYCPAGDFHIDPWRPVPRAVITHAHADHARRGHGAYLAQADGAGKRALDRGRRQLQFARQCLSVQTGNKRRPADSHQPVADHAFDAFAGHRTHAAGHRMHALRRSHQCASDRVLRP